MTSSQDVRPYDVWRLSFEYENQPGVTKERPVVVGAVDQENAFVLAVKVTGHGPRPEYDGEIRLVDWAEAGLDKPSTARCSKTLIVPRKAFDGRVRYGRLSRRDSDAVANALKALGKTL